VARLLGVANVIAAARRSFLQTAYDTAARDRADACMPMLGCAGRPMLPAAALDRLLSWVMRSVASLVGVTLANVACCAAVIAGMSFLFSIAH
jgi:hypothetical protein